MLKLERDAQKFGIFVKDLMENAGREIHRAMTDRFDIEDKDVIIFCGHGNNGGDGLAAATHFTDNPVIILFFGNPEKLGEEAKKYYDLIKDNTTIITIRNKDDIDQFHFQQGHKLILLDALLGTGIEGEVKEPMKMAIDYFNSLQAEKISIDIPSGMNGDTGEYTRRCDVDLTIALHDVKQGAQNENTVIVDIGLEDVKRKLAKLKNHSASSPSNN